MTRKETVFACMRTDVRTDVATLLRALGDPVDFEHGERLRRGILDELLDEQKILRSSNGCGGWWYVRSPDADRARGDGHPTCNGDCAGANPAVGSPRPKARRGFAAMPPATQQAIASLGGKAAHAQGVAHEFTTEEARIAGRKGGLAAQARRAGAS